MVSYNQTLMYRELVLAFLLSTPYSIQDNTSIHGLTDHVPCHTLRHHTKATL